MAPSYPEKIHIVTIAVGKHAAEEEQMYPQRSMVRQALRVALLVTLVVLAVCACGGGQEEARKPRPLPEEEEPLRPGVYRSEEFKPSFYFRVGKGWSSTPFEEASDFLQISRGQTAVLGFVNVQKVYKPTRTGTLNLVDTPKDMVGWTQQHPYLQTSKPEPVMVGGLKGVQLEVVVGDLPQNYLGTCTSVVSNPNCVDLVRLRSGGPILLVEGDKAGVIVLEDVEGETVTIAFVSPASEFGELAPEAQKVIDTVEWGGS
jgi:hypothetical protein